jgi:hypothetical protein
MKICVHSEAYELLRKHVSLETPAYAALLAGTKIEGQSSIVFDQYWIECSDLDAGVYLAAAEEFFPEHLAELESTIAPVLGAWNRIYVKHSPVIYNNVAPKKLYKSHLIVCRATHSEDNAQWFVSAHISWRVAGHSHLHTLKPATPFETEEDATAEGFRMAELWVDNKL